MDDSQEYRKESSSNKTSSLFGLPLKSSMPTVGLKNEFPDLGEEIKNPDAYLATWAKTKRIIFVNDGNHDSLPIRKRIIHIESKLHPYVAAIEYSIDADAPLTHDNVLAALDAFKKQHQDLSPAEQKRIDMNRDSFKSLIDAGTHIEFVESRNADEMRLTSQCESDIHRYNKILLDTSLLPQVREGFRELKRIAQESLNATSAIFETKVAERVFDLYQKNKETGGLIVVRLGKAHVDSTGNRIDVNERLAGLGVPENQIGIIDVLSAMGVPEKAVQINGVDKSHITYMEIDLEHGQAAAALGGKTVTEIRFIDEKDIRQISDIAFFEHGSGNNKFLGLRINSKPNDPLPKTVQSLARIDTNEPIVTHIRLLHNGFLGADKQSAVDVKVFDLPRKKPDEKLTLDEMLQWRDRLQKGYDQLRDQIKAKAPAKKPVVEPQAHSLGLPFPTSAIALQPVGIFRQ